VIVNEPMPTWKKDLEVHNSVLTVVQIFRSQKDKHAFRINGEYPEADQIAYSVGFVAWMSNLW
jgi:hypothetical protein